MTSDRERRNERLTLGAPVDRNPDASAAVAGVVLAGVSAWGGGAFERTLRGPLLPVAQEPLLSYPLRWLRAGGVRGAAVCAGAATGAVRERFGGGSSLRMTLSYYEDAAPRGPAGCARDAALATTAERFVVVEGAFIPTLDLRALLAAHRESGAAATTVVEIDRRRNAMRQSWPAMPGGVYVFERHVLERVPATGFQDIKQGLLERLYAHGEHVAVHEVAGLSPRVLDLHSYAGVSSWLIASAVDRRAAALDEVIGSAIETLWLETSTHETTRFDGSRVDAPARESGPRRQATPDDGGTYVPFAEWSEDGDTLVHPTAFVHPTARLIGPVLVGPNAFVDERAVVVGPTSIGPGAIIDAGAVVSRSELWADAHVGTGANVDGSLLADGAAVGARRHVSGAVLTASPRVTPVPNGTRVPSARASSHVPSSVVVPVVPSLSVEASVRRAALSTPPHLPLQ
ncbi:transferase hexapeptide repeat containing protein [Gemmatirosa kalamazoonensis]|uniref:Transferase hexapeptide repeat containing protein n=2 Tax=Gemmatirosa kalamazoonensis TaxID=861299 RepID=W0R9A4_9BACT|nr:transferase hexapeptide repeat containing protein [Gemmatirosa kalamazoonensis]